MAKKLNKEQQSNVDKLALARDLYGKGSREGLQVQNQINKIFGINKVHDVSNAPTSKQMRIAKAGRSEIVVGQKIGAVKKAVARAMEGSDKTSKNIKTALNTSKHKKRKTIMAGDM
jgi:histone H3/H4